jgi:hypothetical protein
LKTAVFGDAASRVVLPVVAAPTCKSIPLDDNGWFSGITTHVKTRSLCMLLLA